MKKLHDSLRIFLSLYLNRIYNKSPPVRISHEYQQDRKDTVTEQIIDVKTSQLNFTTKKAIASFVMAQLISP